MEFSVHMQLRDSHHVYMVVARRDTAMAGSDKKINTICYLSHSVLIIATPTPTLNLPLTIMQIQ